MNTTPGPTLFLGYIRVSTRRQDLSIEAQTDAVRRAADYHAGGAAEFELHAEPDTSGRTRFCEREQGISLLARARAALAEGWQVTVIVPKVDRLGRDVIDVSETVRLFDAENIRIIFLDINADTRTAMGRGFMQIAAVFAELEVARIRERIQDTINTKFDKREICGETPFGWDAAPNGQLSKSGRPSYLLADNLEEQKWILHMAGLWQRGESYYAIAKDLASRGVATKKGGTWRATRVEKILNNKTVQHWLAGQAQLQAA